MRKPLKAWKSVIHIGDKLPDVVYAYGDLNFKGRGIFNCGNTRFEIGGVFILNDGQTIDATDSIWKCKYIMCAGDIAIACSMELNKDGARFYQHSECECGCSCH